MLVHVASADGEAKFWLLVDTREHFLSFEGFLWFKGASVEAILTTSIGQT